MNFSCIHNGESGFIRPYARRIFSFSGHTRVTSVSTGHWNVKLLLLSKVVGCEVCQVRQGRI